MRKPVAIITCICLAIAALTASLATADTTKTIKVGDDWFQSSSPRVPRVTVRQNTIVRFKFVGNDVHNVIGYRGQAQRNKFESPIKSSGYYNKRMTTRGTFTIICDIHGAYNQSMKLVVTR